MPELCFCVPGPRFREWGSGERDLALGAPHRSPRPCHMVSGLEIKGLGVEEYRRAVPHAHDLTHRALSSRGVASSSPPILPTSLPRRLQGRYHVARHGGSEGPDNTLQAWLILHVSLSPVFSIGFHHWDLASAVRLPEWVTTYPRGWPKSTELIMLRRACYCFPYKHPARPLSRLRKGVHGYYIGSAWMLTAPATSCLARASGLCWSRVWDASTLLLAWAVQSSFHKLQ